MPADSHGEDRNAPDSELALSPNAEGHLTLLRGYFGFQGYVGILAAVLAPFARVLPRGFVTINGNPWLVWPLVVVNTWAAFRTRRLLRERNRDGAWMAGVVFASDLVAAWSTGHLGFGALLSGIGIVLAINVYREIRRVESADRPEEKAMSRPSAP